MRLLFTYPSGNVETLYNFAALEDLRQIAPEGFRVATLDDIVNLVDYLGGQAEAGGELKAVTRWENPNTEATDSKGFKAVGAGIRDHLGAFADKLFQTKIWIDNRF